MNTIKQIIAVTTLNLRNLPQRLASSAVAVVGVGAVVLVFAAVLSMAAGLERTMMAAGSQDTAVILRSGSTSELNSGLSNEQVLLVNNAPGVLKDGDSAIVSAELYVVTDVKKRSNDGDANVPFRGVQPGAFAVRDNVRITEGRMFEPGKKEIVVGRGAREEFKGLDVGQTIRFGQNEWSVVGAFEAGGSVSESEPSVPAPGVNAGSDEVSCTVSTLEESSSSTPTAQPKARVEVRRAMKPRRAE